VTRRNEFAFSLTRCHDAFIMKQIYWLLTFIVLLILSTSSFARTPVSDESGGTVDEDMPSKQVVPAQVAPSSGSDEAAARKYFDKKSPSPSHDYTKGTLDPDDHYLSIHVGGFFGSDSYKWGATDHVSNPGRLQGGVTYGIGPLGKFADWALRADFISYGFPEGNAVNMSVLPMILFPDAGTAFPLYFGIGIGPGVFFQQIGNESTISFNYELVAGARFFDVIGDAGFFVETGLKNEIHLLSDGQFNGFFLSGGVLFVF
jgi:hypothetical protein